MKKAIYVLSRVGTMFTAAETLGFYSTFEFAAEALHKRIDREITAIIAKCRHFPSDAACDDVHVLLPAEYAIRYEQVEIEDEVLEVPDVTDLDGKDQRDYDNSDY